MIFIFQHPRNFKRFVPVKLENISANSDLKVKFDFPLKSKIKLYKIHNSSVDSIPDAIPESSRAFSN